MAEANGLIHLHPTGKVFIFHPVTQTSLSASKTQLSSQCRIDKNWQEKEKYFDFEILRVLEYQNAFWARSSWSFTGKVYFIAQLNR